MLRLHLLMRCMLHRANNTNFYYLILFVYPQVIVNDVLKSDLPFCLHFDETSTTQVKKQMNLTLHYWSQTHDEVWVNFNTSFLVIPRVKWWLTISSRQWQKMAFQ